MSNPRVIIITKGVSRIVGPIVEKHNVVGIIEDAPRKKQKVEKSNFLRILERVYAIFKTPYKTLKLYSEEKDIPYFFMSNGNCQNLEKWIKELKPDILVVYTMSRLLRRNIFDIPKYKTINLHPSLLPKYKGPNPWFWSYFNKDNIGGVTLHYIDEGEDTGNIIYQEEYSIPLGMKSPMMQDLAIGEIGTNLILKALSNADRLPNIKQTIQPEIQRARNIKKEEHQSIIDWENFEIERIWHILRGTELWLNAFEQPKGINKGLRWIIEGYEKLDMSDYIIGKVYKEKGHYTLACKDGKIHLSLKRSIKKMILAFIQ